MKHTLTLAVFLLFLVPAAYTQQRPAENSSNMKEVNGYIIRVFRADAGTYGYEIIKGKERLVLQRRNPYTGSPLGLSKKEDALKTATWLVTKRLKKQNLQSSGRELPERLVLSRPIPEAVAKHLGINPK